MLHAVAMLGAVIWFGLNGLLWYAKPSELVWLAGSAILGLIFFAGFFWYLALSDMQRCEHG
jgi:quinol-cytochrome oxidoreductase complex cytochrome b subunit